MRWIAVLSFDTKQINFWSFTVQTIFSVLNIYCNWIFTWNSECNVGTMTIFTWSYSYFWSLTIFSTFTFITLRSLDVAFFFPVAVILNEDVTCFGIDVFIAVFTLSRVWINFAIQDIFSVAAISSVTTCCSITSIAAW